MRLNTALNGVEVEFRGEDLIGSDEGWDVVLAGDVFYDSAFAGALIPWFRRLAERGAAVVVGDPGRSYCPKDRMAPLATYDPASIHWSIRGDRVWFSLMVDPVNPAAVARQKADPEYLDLFEVDGSRAVRRARIFAPKKKLTWGWAGDTLWVLEKNVGFSRGGKSLRLFRLNP